MGPSKRCSGTCDKSTASMHNRWSVKLFARFESGQKAAAPALCWGSSAETAFCRHTPTDSMEEEDELSLAQPVTNRVLWIDGDKEETEDTAGERIMQ